MGRAAWAGLLGLGCLGAVGCLGAAWGHFRSRLAAPTPPFWNGRLGLTHDWVKTPMAHVWQTHTHVRWGWAAWGWAAWAVALALVAPSKKTPTGLKKPTPRGIRRKPLGK